MHRPFSRCVHIEAQSHTHTVTLSLSCLHAHGPKYTHLQRINDVEVRFRHSLWLQALAKRLLYLDLALAILHYLKYISYCTLLSEWVLVCEMHCISNFVFSLSWKKDLLHPGPRILVILCSEWIFWEFLNTVQAYLLKLGEYEESENCWKFHMMSSAQWRLERCIPNGREHLRDLLVIFLSKGHGFSFYTPHQKRFKRFKYWQIHSSHIVSVMKFIIAIYWLVLFLWFWSSDTMNIHFFPVEASTGLIKRGQAPSQQCFLLIICFLKNEITSNHIKIKLDKTNVFFLVTYSNSTSIF